MHAHTYTHNTHMHAHTYTTHIHTQHTYLSIYVHSYICTIFICIKARFIYTQGLKYIPGGIAE